MKSVKITLLLLLLFNISFAQSFKDYEIKRLNNFKINTDSISLYNSVNYMNLKSILAKERIRKKNKTAAIAISSLSALTMALGATVISNSRNDQEGLGQSIGSMIIAAGVIELGVTIPLIISSNKRKKERDKLIELYKK